MDTPRPGPVGAEPLPRRAARILLALLLLLLVLEHARAHLGEASYEHFAAVNEKIALIDAGQALHPGTEAEGTHVAGGGALFVWLHRGIAWFGLPYTTLQALNLLFDLVVVLAWLAFARRRLTPALAWCSTYWLVLYDLPKLYLLENSALVAFPSVLLYIAFREGLARGGWHRHVLAALFFWLAMHFGLVAAFIFPVLLVALWRERPAAFWPGATLYALAAAAITFSLAAGLEPASEGKVSELVELVDGGRLVPALAHAGQFLLEYLANPALLLGFGAVLLGGLSRLWPGGRSEARFALAWLALSVIPTAVVDEYGARYHFAMAAPAEALICGLGLVWLTAALERRAGPRWPWWRQLGALALATCLLSGALAATSASRAPAARVPAGHDSFCSWRDTGCNHWRIATILDDLARQGVATPGAALRFHGVYNTCLQGAWSWRRRQASREGLAPSAGPARDVLLINANGAPALGPGQGVPTGGDLIALSGAHALAQQQSFREGVEGGVVQTITVPHPGGGLVYLAFQSGADFTPARISFRRGERALRPAAQCHHPHRDAYSQRYDGYYLLPVGSDDGRPLRVTIPFANDDPVRRAVVLGVPR